MPNDNGPIIKKLDSLENTVKQKLDSFTKSYQSAFEMNSAFYATVEKYINKDNDSSGTVKKDDSVVNAINNNTSIITAAILSTKGIKVGISSLTGMIDKGLKESLNTLNNVFNQVQTQSNKISTKETQASSVPAAVKVDNISPLLKSTTAQLMCVQLFANASSLRNPTVCSASI